MSRQTAPAGISAREAEVLTLVGEHRSNAEIGTQLYISVRTVETHVSSLLRKPGSGSAGARRPRPSWPGPSGPARRWPASRRR